MSQSVEARSRLFFFSAVFLILASNTATCYRLFPRKINFDNLEKNLMDESQKLILEAEDKSKNTNCHTYLCDVISASIQNAKILSNAKGLPTSSHRSRPEYLNPNAQVNYPFNPENRFENYASEDDKKYPTSCGEITCDNVENYPEALIQEILLTNSAFKDQELIFFNNNLRWYSDDGSAEPKEDEEYEIVDEDDEDTEDVDEDREDEAENKDESFVKSLAEGPTRTPKEFVPFTDEVGRFANRKGIYSTLLRPLISPTRGHGLGGGISVTRNNPAKHDGQMNPQPSYMKPSASYPLSAEPSYAGAQPSVTSRFGGHSIQQIYCEDRIHETRPKEAINRENKVVLVLNPDHSEIVGHNWPKDLKCTAPKHCRDSKTPLNHVYYCQNKYEWIDVKIVNVESKNIGNDTIQLSVGCDCRLIREKKVRYG